MIMDYLLLGIATCVIIAIILLYFKHWVNKNNEKKTKKRSKTLQAVKCPICNSRLFTDENIISKIYRPMNVPDQLMTISGCPHCYPKTEPGIKRLCPVCKKTIEQDQTLTARLFNKSAGKKHVHVVGCSNCHKPRAD